MKRWEGSLRGPLNCVAEKKKEGFMGTLKLLLLGVLICLIGTAGAAQAQLRFIPLQPCRVADTRNATGPFGGPSLAAQSSRDFVIPNSSCGVPSTAAAYSLNVTVIPHTILGYLTIWPSGQAQQPIVSTLNSLDGRIKANAAIVPAGTGGAVSVYVTDTTDVVLDINGYFLPANDPSAPRAFFPVPPCRVADTRNPSGSLGGPSLIAGQARSFPVLSSNCNIPSTAQAYSLNFTVVPQGPLGFLTTWPTGMAQPLVSTLNALTGTLTANAAIVPAGVNGAISAYVTDASDVVIDVNGYFAPSSSGSDLSLYTLPPCRVLDTRLTTGSFFGSLTDDTTASPCGLIPGAQAVVLNATVVPAQPLGYLTLWPAAQAQPFVSTLNALDGQITSNMAIVPTSSGVIDAYATDRTQLVLDTSGYFASGTGPPPTTYLLTVARSGSGSGTITSLDGKINCGAVCAVSYVSGTTVTLTASAASGSSFAGWSGGGCSGTGNCTVAVNSALSVTATFSSNSSSLTGNWEFDTTSTAIPGVTSQVGGSIVQAGTTISGVLHVLGSDCFNVFTDNVTVTGTITGNSLTITSGAVNGQVINFTGTATSTTLSGTYTITGGCAGGDHGNVSGFKVPSVTGNWTGSFTSSLGPSTNVTAALTQGSAFADGSFALSGTVTFQSSACFASGTITAGAISSPTGSSIFGTFLWVEINTSNGLVVFLGTLNQAGNQIFGDYFVFGGSCDGDTGTGTVNKT